MSARSEILARVRTAAAGAVAPPVPRSYRTAGEFTPDDVVALCAERIADYRATVHRTSDPAGVLASLLSGRVVVPDGFPAELLPAGLDVVRDDPPLSADALDAVDAVVTTCRCAIALTGTIVLDHGPGQGRRALTLVPDRHMVLLRADQVQPSVPDAIAVLDGSPTQTWISGPSATSDIELERVEGVHGPRTLHVVLVD